MKNLIHTESTLTDRYKTTIPKLVRKALDLNKKDKISYDILNDGRVIISKVEIEHNDPVIEKFLKFLETDMINNPENIKLLSKSLTEEANELTKGMDNIDLNATLKEEE